MRHIDYIPEILETFPKSNYPRLMQYIEFSDKAHDELMRCNQCNIKYNQHELSRIGVGKFVCRFCMNVGA